MATVTRYVNTDSTPGGTGLTNATSGTDRAYASLAEAEAAEQTNLSGTGNVFQFICDGSAEDTTGCVVDGWTMTATEYLHIRAAYEHNGVLSTSHYRMRVDGAAALNPLDDYLRVTGIQIDESAVTPNTYGIYTQEDYGVYDRILIRFQNATDNIQAGIVDFYNVDNLFTNCIVYADADQGNTSSASWYAYGHGNSVASSVCRFVNCLAWAQAAFSGTGVLGFGWREVGSNGLCYVQNCIAVGDFIEPFDDHATILTSYCISSDASADGTGSQTNVAGADIFTDEDARDFTLKAGSPAIDAGLDVSAYTSVDITGASRPSGSGWDIGPFEYVTAGTTPVSAEREVRWGLLASVQQSAEASWSLLEAVSAAREARWALVQSAEAGRALQWSVLAPVQQSVEAQWSALQAASAQRRLDWGVLQSVDAARALQWGVLSGLTLSPVSAQRALQWTLREAVQSERRLDWRLIASVNAARALQWSLTQSVQAGREIDWGVLGGVEAARAVQWSVVIPVSDALALQWGLRAPVAEALEIQWSLLGELGPTPVMTVFIPADVGGVDIPADAGTVRIPADLSTLLM